MIGSSYNQTLCMGTIVSNHNFNKSEIMLNFFPEKVSRSEIRGMGVLCLYNLS